MSTRPNAYLPFLRHNAPCFVYTETTATYSEGIHQKRSFKSLAIFTLL